MARDSFADRLKGYACFLVVFGHVIMGIRLAGIDIPDLFYMLENFIWSFHVALFLFLSGYVYKITGGWESKKTRLNFIKHKLINLGVPYVVFSVIYILINAFIGGANTQSSYMDVFMIWKAPVAQYWFLYALFFLFCIWTALSGAMKNWQITVFVVVVTYMAPIFDISFGSLDFVIYSALAFGLGTFINIADLKNVNVLYKLLVIVAHIIIGGALSYFDIIDRAVIKEVMIIFGIYVSILLISIVQELKIISKFLDFMNKYSFQTYLLHTIFTAGIRIVLVKVGITNWIVHILAGCVLGIGISVVCAIIAEKTKVFDIVFFPAKAYKKIAGKRQ